MDSQDLVGVLVSGGSSSPEFPLFSLTPQTTGTWLSDEKYDIRWRETTQLYDLSWLLYGSENESPDEN